MRERLVAARKERVGRREIAALEAIDFARARAGGGDDGDDGHQARRAPPRRGPGHAHRRAARRKFVRPPVPVTAAPPRPPLTCGACALLLAVDEAAHRAPVQHMLGANELTYNAEHIIRIEKVRAAAPSPPPLSRRAAARRAPLLLSAPVHLRVAHPEPRLPEVSPPAGALCAGLARRRACEASGRRGGEERANGGEAGRGSGVARERCTE